MTGPSEWADPPRVDLPSVGDVAALLAATAAALTTAAGAVDIVTVGVTVPDGVRDEMAVRGQTVALTDPAASGPVVQVAHGRVLAVGTGRHPVSPAGSSRCVGWLRVSASDRTAAGRALERAAADVAAIEAPPSDVFAWVLLALVRGGVSVHAEPITPWPWGNAGELIDVPPEASDRIRLVRANRADDGWYSVTVLRRLSKPLTAIAARRDWAPNAITIVSLLVGLCAAGFFALGSRWALVAGAVLLQASLVIDCSDGEVARLTGRFSRSGAWLDAVTDRVKEFAAYAGLAAGAGAVWGVDVWWLAAAAMVLQTVRHLMDYTFDIVQRSWETVVIPRSVTVDLTEDVIAYPAPTGASRAAMFRRTLFLPIGERWLLLSVTAVVLGPVWALRLIFAAGLISLCYATLGRARRTLAWSGGPVAIGPIVAQLDTAPFGIPLPLGGRSGAILWGAGVAAATGLIAVWGSRAVAAGLLWFLAAVLLLGVRAALFRPAWAAPAAVAAIEMFPWVAAGAVLAPASGPEVFAVLFTIAFHRYDLLYRAAAGVAMPTWLKALSLGAPVRLAILAVTVLVASAQLGVVAGALAVYLGIVTILVASAQWLTAESGSQR